MGACSDINSAWRCRGEGGKGCHAKHSDWMHVLFSLCVFLLCTSRYFGNRKPSSKAQKQGYRSMQHVSLWAFHRLSVSHSKMPVLTSAKSTQGHKRFWLDPIAPQKSSACKAHPPHTRPTFWNDGLHPNCSGASGQQMWEAGPFYKKGQADEDLKPGWFYQLLTLKMVLTRMFVFSDLA